MPPTSSSKFKQTELHKPNDCPHISSSKLPETLFEKINRNWLKTFVIGPLLWLCVLWYTQQFSLLIQNQASAQLVIGNRLSIIRNVPELAARHDIQPYFMWQNNLADAFKYGIPAFQQVWSRVGPEHLIHYKQEGIADYVNKADNPKNIFVGYHIHVRICKQLFCNQRHHTLGQDALYVSEYVFRTLMGLLMRHGLQ